MGGADFFMIQNVKLLVVEPIFHPERNLICKTEHTQQKLNLHYYEALRVVPLARRRLSGMGAIRFYP